MWHARIIRYTAKAEAVLGVAGEADAAFVADNYAAAATLDLVVQPYPVPEQRTTYICQGFQMPYDASRHLVRYEAIIPPESDPEARSVVHHILLFACWEPAPTTPEICPTMPHNCTCSLQQRQNAPRRGYANTNANANSNSTPQRILSSGVL